MWTKILKYSLGLIVIATAALASYLKLFLPDVGTAPEMTIKQTTERIERGEYLANHVMACTSCHTDDKTDKIEEGEGGRVFGRNEGLPGRYYASNITPAHFRDWTDGELFRAITAGVSKDGRALFPIMPYKSYGQLDEEDIKAVIAFMRNLKPVVNRVGQSASDFPMSYIINTLPEKPKFQPRPPKEDQVAYGKYLVTAAACYDCHTKQVNGQFTGQPFAGGMRFPNKGAKDIYIYSPNITPHEDGIGNWTETQFIERFKQYEESDLQITDTQMPWKAYAGMKEEDLQAIYAYLKTLQAYPNEAPQ